MKHGLAQSVSTIIGVGTSISGDIEVTGVIRVDGRVHGSIQASGAVILGKEARVDADIIADSAVISGQVRGDVLVLRILRLKTGGVIEGDVFAPRLDVEAGASINGRIRASGKRIAPVSERDSFRTETGSETADPGMTQPPKPSKGA